jgi:hypothetical protein
VSDAGVSEAAGGYILRPLGARQTRWIRGKSNLMVNFVAQASENPWLAQLDVTGTNTRLKALAAEVEAALQSGEWAGLSQEEKGARSPEVHQLAWLPIETVVRVMQSSIAEDTFVNDWQRAEFGRLGVKQRDPMSVTMASVLDLENLLSDGGWGDARPDFDAMVQEANFTFSANVHSKVMTGQDPLPSQIPQIDLNALPAELRRIITKGDADGLNGPASGRARI